MKVAVRAIGAVVAILAVTPVYSQYPEKIGVKSHVLNIVGTRATDCGAFRGNPAAGRNALSAQQQQAVSACATNARSGKSGWYFSVQGSTDDSLAATGLLGLSDGRIRFFLYDSAPCGGRHCAEYFETSECVAPPNEAVQPLMKCGPVRMPGESGRPTRR